MSAPASLPARILNQGRYEAVMMLRNGEQLILAVVLPLMAMVALVVTPLLDGYGTSRINMATPGIFALCAMSTAFTGQGIATGFDRRYGVLRYLSTTPLGRAGLIAGKVIAVLAVLCIQVVLVSVVALLLGWRPELAGLVPAALQLALGAVAFTALGLLVAGTVRPEATLAITNLLWILLAAAGGIIIPVGNLPDLLQPFIEVLPSAALGDALRSALIDSQFNISATLILLAWTILGGLGAVRWFKWS
ncbi:MULTISPECIES: ABC transporter permease [unclassified Arthrobacter]|uniref:ABC transporter permease n=1 Tax=unclassified Arthrobacter TaxID=235627 RepID=UPI001D13824C|nr:MULTISPECIES: ABC transporter permease [unclassified Arthrobacter]MCC3274714.1 ABC transporter permease [Arthrobacter sp. zg-Y20]MCC9177698.1 ABC transporter permease [Arthrobacter sp. zg-Y750]MDK1314870.1 ABC transporter permease [Arthrobacter sp. zg.Y20]MDK1327731.1 ABC transporter permease [Arthrobacter sp. zg-Y1143]WIB04728.1 ABC transporter permease [Arthrobacter sp. zg-Y20]